MADPLLPLVLASLLQMPPLKADEPRAQLIAESTVYVVRERQTAKRWRWRRSDRWLASVLIELVKGEGGHGSLAVHNGSKLGLAGERCLTQINPTNPAWRHSGAVTIDDLTGVTPEATVLCLRAAAITLDSSDAYCQARHYRTHWLPAMLTVYATGNRCWPATKLAGPRARSIRRRVSWWSSLK